MAAIYVEVGCLSIDRDQDGMNEVRVTASDWMVFTPRQARDVAARLIEVADEIEADPE